jgi:hypothetical protein
MSKFSIVKLKELIDEVKNNPDKLHDLIIMMSDSSTREVIEKLLKHDDEYNEETFIDNASALLEAAQFIYTYSGEQTGMSDSEYDILYEAVSSKQKHPSLFLK